MGATYFDLLWGIGSGWNLFACKLLKSHPLAMVGELLLFLRKM